MTRVSEATMQRKLNHVLEIELNFVGCQRIRESIERLSQLGFEVLQSAQSFVQCCFIHQTTRSVDEQTNIFVKLEFRWKLHRSLTRYHALFGASAREDFRRAVPTEHRAISRRLLVLEIFEQ